MEVISKKNHTGRKFVIILLVGFLLMGISALIIWAELYSGAIGILMVIGIALALIGALGVYKYYPSGDYGDFTPI